MCNCCLRKRFAAKDFYDADADVDADVDADAAADGQVTLHKMNCLKHCTVFAVIIFSNQMGESQTRPHAGKHESASQKAQSRKT